MTVFAAGYGFAIRQKKIYVIVFLVHFQFRKLCICLFSRDSSAAWSLETLEIVDLLEWHIFLIFESNYSWKFILVLKKIPAPTINFEEKMIKSIVYLYHVRVIHDMHTTTLWLKVAAWNCFLFLQCVWFWYTLMNNTGRKQHDKTLGTQYWFLSCILFSGQYKTQNT